MAPGKMPGASIKKTMIHIKSYAKINLSLDMGERLPSGMHPVDMIMQATSLSDDVMINVRKAEDFSIELKTNRDDLPVDSENIAYRAAELMIKKCRELSCEMPETEKEKAISIFIDKEIPIAAGLAGGSGNAAAVLHGLNALWELGLSLSELCEMGKELGSDVPFCVMAQARKNIHLPHHIQGDELAITCARARGTGTELVPVEPLHAQVIIAKPEIGVSTKEVYTGMDSLSIEARPDNDKLERALNNFSGMEETSEMINVLENYTLNAYPEVQELKDLMTRELNAKHVLMSGSGPSVFALFDINDDLGVLNGVKILKEKGYIAYPCKTI